MAQRPRAIAWMWGVGLIGGAAVFVAQLAPIRATVEDSLTTRSQEALVADGYAGLDVRFSGRDGVVSGEVGEAADIEQVEAIVREVEGVRVVRVEDLRAAGTPTTTETAAVPTDEVTSAATPSVAPSAAPTATASEAAPSSTEPPAASEAPASTEPPAPTEPTQPPAPVEPAAPQPDLAAALAAIPTVTFSSGTFSLNPAALPSVDAIAAIILGGPPGQRYEIRAHTDTSGNAGDNQWLSDRRAEATRDALVERGVATERLSIIGLGETQPLVNPEQSAADRDRNRRVEVLPLA